jgi:hypothetical protein
LRAGLTASSNTKQELSTTQMVGKTEALFWRKPETAGMGQKEKAYGGEKGP